MSDAMQAEKVKFDFGNIGDLHIELLEIGAIRLSYKGSVIVKTPEALFMAALASQADAAPEGYQVVPIEPSEKMLDAAYEVDLNVNPSETYCEVYKAMLEASKDKP